MTNGLLSWDAMGAILASAAVGCVGYVGFTVAQVVSVATADDPADHISDQTAAVAAVVDPPVLATYSSAPQATDAPAAAPSRNIYPLRAPAPSARPSAPGRTRPSASARPAAKPAAGTKRTTQAEIKHALWADRQLAAMLRATPQSTLWFGGATWTTPVAAYHLTARFGETSSLWATIHTGLDFAAPTGTPVRAATAGTVTSVGWAGAYGNKIEITHPDGTETWYAHLSRTDVQVGTQVGTGALIGAVGATGNVTGSHLHFEVRPGGGSPVDPDAALREHGVRP